MVRATSIKLNTYEAIIQYFLIWVTRSGRVSQARPLCISRELIWRTSRHEWAPERLALTNHDKEEDMKKADVMAEPSVLPLVPSVKPYTERQYFRKNL